ncbi:MAG: Ig-like domain-containing protein, partial [Sulfuricurvum sp.]|nr:Ig-like domain-containing protein [Sulfuricurvum sp.]
LAEGEIATVTFQYVANDGNGFDGSDGINESSISEPKTVTLTVTGTNDAAVITGASTAELTETHAAQTAGGDLNATDVDSAATFVAQTDVAGTNGYGKFTIGTDGVWTYTMDNAHDEFVVNTDYTDSITVTTADGTMQVITVTIHGTNDAPIAVDNGTSMAPAVTIDEDTSVININVLGNDTDSENDTLSITAASSPNGTVTINSDGTLNFTPEGNFSGDTTINYTISDGNGGSNSATVYLKVNPIADTPTLQINPKTYGVTTNLEEVTFNGTYSTVAVSSLNGGVWHTDNSGGTVEVGYSSTYGVSGGSNKVLELERNPGDPSNLYTTMEVKAGEVYTLSFDYANRLGDTSDMSVYWNGQLVAVIDPSSTTLTAYTINLISEITGTGKLELKANDSNSMGIILDNISLSLVPNTGYAGYLTTLPQIMAGLTDSSETLSLNIGGIPQNYILTDGIHTFTAADILSVATVTGWNLNAISLIAPSGSSASAVPLTVTVTSTESDGSVATSETNVTVTILPDTTGYIGTLGGDTLTGNASNNTLWGLDGNDTLSGEGGRDALIGGAGNDTLTSDFSATSTAMSGDRVIDGGTGIDTFVLSKNNTTIDFTILNSINNPINNIEIIDLGQNGNSDKATLTNLTMQDVIDMTDSNNTLTILGDNKDSVNVPVTSAGYTMTQSTDAGLNVYTYQSSNAGDPTVVLKIDADIQQ